MTFWQWLNGSWVKVISSIGTLNSALIAATAGGMFIGLVDESTIKWLAIFGFFMNAFLVGVGQRNTTQEKVADAKIEVAKAMDTAIKANPTQGGFVRPVMLALLLGLSALSLPLMQGCALLTPADSQVPAGSFDSRISDVNNSIATGRDIVRILLQAEKISPEDAEDLQRQADNLRTGSDLAYAMRGTNLADAEAKLLATQKLLEAFQAYLTQKQKPLLNQPEQPQ